MKQKEPQNSSLNTQVLLMDIEMVVLTNLIIILKKATKSLILKKNSVSVLKMYVGNTYILFLIDYFVV